MTIPRTTPGTRRAVRPLAAMIAALAGFGLGAPIASAGESEQIRTNGGKVQFQARGDILRAHDTRRDGYSVRAILTWFDRTDNTLQKARVTDPNSRGVSRATPLAIPEGTTVRLKLCYIDNTGPVSCSKEQDAVA